MAHDQIVEVIYRTVEVLGRTVDVLGRILRGIRKVAGQPRKKTVVTTDIDAPLEVENDAYVTTVTVIDNINNNGDIDDD